MGTSSHNIMVKWIVNMSLSWHMEAQISQRTHFSIVPKYSPKDEYIATVQGVCLKLASKAETECRTEISHLLKRDCSSRPSISRQEAKVLREESPGSSLKWTRGYLWWCQINVTMSTGTRTPKGSLQGDPTIKHKNNPIQILRTIKVQGGLSDVCCKGLYLTSVVPQISWTPQISQTWHPP